MLQQPPALIFSASDVLPDGVEAWILAQGVAVRRLSALDELKRRTLRSRPRIVVFDARDLDPPAAEHASLAACRWLKADSYTGIVPAVVLVPPGEEAVALAFAAGADEVLVDDPRSECAWPRLDAVLRRSDRDTSVHPSTRLPGGFAIEAEIARRLAAGERFGVCYADLDHFKEFNDRYGYYQGDRVIRMLAMILHDVVKGGCGDAGFVGHIGGDDFIFVVPLASVADTCREIIAVFDLLVPLQYSEPDRRTGYFFGKDRRGRLHRVPLMTLSIGVVTNERRSFANAAQVSDLATEMKSYAKSLPGSVFSVDRRGMTPAPSAKGEGTTAVVEDAATADARGGDA